MYIFIVVFSRYVEEIEDMEVWNYGFLEYDILVIFLIRDSFLFLIYIRVGEYFIV